jgi:hypothetical protein
MDEKYLTFRKFNSILEVEEILDILKQNEISFELEDNSQITPSIIVGETSAADFRLKLKAADFEKGDRIINSFVENSIGTIEDDYYLLSFSDDELLEVINKRDEWSHYDYNVAKIELKKRGLEINEKLENAIRQTRLNELKHKEKGSVIWIVFGYLSAFLGGLLGIVIGFNFWKSKLTLPTGERVPVYNEETRTNGMYITILGIFMFTFYTILGLMRFF